jgi:hypothetical protein
MLQLLLNLVSAGIETLLLSGIKFVYACVKEVYRLWDEPCFDTLHQLLITVEELWSQPVLLVFKQVAVARSVVKQLPVEMPQQCSSANAHCHEEVLYRMSAFHAFCYEWPYAVFSVLRNTLVTLLWSSIAWIPSSAPLSCRRKQLPSDLWQRDNVCLNFFNLFGNACASTALTEFSFQYSQTKPMFHQLLLVRCDWESHCHLRGIRLKSLQKAVAIVCVLCTLVSISKPISSNTCDNLT